MTTFHLIDQLLNPNANIFNLLFVFHQCTKTNQQPSSQFFASGRGSQFCTTTLWWVSSNLRHRVPTCTCTGSGSLLFHPPLKAIFPVNDRFSINFSNSQVSADLRSHGSHEVEETFGNLKKHHVPYIGFCETLVSCERLQAFCCLRNFARLLRLANFCNPIAVCELLRL